MLKRIPPILLRWLPAILVMASIFFFSSRPSDDLPNFDFFDDFVKKSGHVIGYGLLAFSYLHGFNRRDRRYFNIAWLLAVLYALTDEYHQSFVAGRNASIWDVVLFDNLGAILALYYTFAKRQKMKL